MENNVIDLEKIQEILDGGMDKAKKVLENDKEMNDLLKQVQTKIDEVPILRSTLEDAQTLFSLVRSYVKKEYTEISPKVIIIMVSAFLYLIKKKDLINDRIPILGWLDDAAVLAVALKAIEPELKAYKEWADKR